MVKFFFDDKVLKKDNDFQKTYFSTMIDMRKFDRRDNLSMKRVISRF